MKITAAWLLATIAWSSCAPSTPQTRIEKQPAKYAGLGKADRDFALQGKIRRGMTSDAVELAWGAPARKFVGSKHSKHTERWDYVGSQPVGISSFYYGGFGYPYGGYGQGVYSGAGFTIAPELVQIHYLKASVWFVDHRVESWEQLQ